MSLTASECDAVGSAIKHQIGVIMIRSNQALADGLGDWAEAIRSQDIDLRTAATKLGIDLR